MDGMTNRDSLDRGETTLLDDAVQLKGHHQVRVDRSRDALLTDFGRATLDDRYLMPGEGYQDLFARVASYYSDNAPHAQRLYDYISKLWLMPATPVLSNGGTARGLPISCFLNEASDSLDGIVGLIPGLGDILGGLASLIILVAAWVRGVPYVALLRMVANVAISVLVGSVPIAGDVFDIAWKANRRNYKLLTRHLAQPHKHTWKDWAFLFCLGTALCAIFLAPLLLLYLLLRWLLPGH